MRKGKVSGRKSDKTMSFIDQADNVINHSSVSNNIDKWGVSRLWCGEIIINYFKLKII